MMVDSNMVASSNGRPDGIDEMYLMTVDVVVVERNIEQLVILGYFMIDDRCCCHLYFFSM